MSDDLDVVCCWRALRLRAGAFPVCRAGSIAMMSLASIFVSSVAHVDHRAPAVVQTLCELLSRNR